MNYIELINRFWQCDIERSFNPSDTRLYFYLLHTCNALHWKQPFGHSDRHLSMILQMSVPTVRDAKNRLKQRGIICFKAPEKASKGYEGQTKFWFPTVQINCTDGLTVPLTDGCTDGLTVPLTNNKLNQTKLNNISLYSGEQKFICESLFEVMEKLLSDKLWLEPVCMNNHKTQQEIEDFIKCFFVELQNREDYHKTEREAKDHFAKWLSIKVNSNQKQKGGKNATDRTGSKPDTKPKQYGVY